MTVSPNYLRFYQEYPLLVIKKSPQKICQKSSQIIKSSCKVASRVTSSSSDTKWDEEYQGKSQGYAL